MNDGIGQIICHHIASYDPEGDAADDDCEGCQENASQDGHKSKEQEAGQAEVKEAQNQIAVDQVADGGGAGP